MAGALLRLQSGLIEAFVLDSIAREKKHGYALLRELEGLFGAPPSRNRLYPLLARLEEEGFILAEQDPAAGRERRKYSLTGKGLARLRDYKVLPAALESRILEFWGAPGPPGTGAPEATATVGPPEPPGVTVAPDDLAALFSGGLGCKEAGVEVRRYRDRTRVDVGFPDCDYGNRPGCPSCPVTRLVGSLKRSYL